MSKPITGAMALAMAAWAVSGTILQVDAAAPRPNVVVIITDDQRGDCLSRHEKPLLGMRTPHIDRLAVEGANFRNMFVTTSLCSPARASFLSGLYARTHGVLDNFTEFPEHLPSYPRQLRQAGYATAYIGKWHMGEDNDDKRLGFDHFITHKGQGKYWDTEFRFNGGQRRVVKGYYTTVVTDMAEEWLNQQRGDRPFLLILGHKAPHGPFVPEPKYENLYDDAPVKYPATAFQLDSKPDWVKQRLPTWHGIHGPLYGFRENYPDASPEGVETFAKFVRSYTATINSVDDSVGRIYQTLRDGGHLDNTIIVFVGDNGFLLGEHGMIDKRTMHEESIRVPMVVRYPKAIKPGTEIEQMVLNIDLAPSLLDLCGVEPLPSVHGRSWKPLFEGRSDNWRTSWFYEYNYEKQFPYTPNVRGVRTDEWKYVHYPHGDGKPDRHKAELYHLKTDPREVHNLIDDPRHAQKVVRLQAELVRLMQQIDGLPDRMPLDEGIKIELPEESIR